MDVEKCHDEIAVEDRTGRELAGEDSTKDTWIHASPFSRTGRNQILDEHDFDQYVDERCQRFYSDEGRPGLPPGRYFRLFADRLLRGLGR